jgi:hypothetical protein
LHTRTCHDTSRRHVRRDRRGIVAEMVSRRSPDAHCR